MRRQEEIGDDDDDDCMEPEQHVVTMVFVEKHYAMVGGGSLREIHCPCGGGGVLAVARGYLLRVIRRRRDLVVAPGG
jgi:hypothetical protein